MRRAVTLVEILIVLFITALLTLLLLAGIRSMRLAARDTIDLSNLRLTMVDFHTYASDHHDIVVNAGLPGDSNAEWFYGGVSWERAIYIYESHQKNWVRVLARWAGGGSAHWHSTHDDRTVQGAVDLTGRPSSFDRYDYMSNYLYSRTLFTAPNAWTISGLSGIDFTVYARDYFKVVRFSEIESPASKGVLVHLDRPGEDMIHVAFADGAVSPKRLSDGIRPTARPPLRASDRPGLPVLATLNGYLGHDY